MTIGIISIPMMLVGIKYTQQKNNQFEKHKCFEFTAWVKVNELPISGEVFLLSNGGWQERWKISLPSHGKPVFTTHSGGACCSDMDSGDTNELVVGEWRHVVMVHDGTKDP